MKIHYKLFAFGIIIYGLLWSFPAASQVRLPRLVRDSMVLQRDKPIHIWGWASKGEKISVQFHGKEFKASADKNGKWSMLLPSMKAGGPYTMKVSGKNTIILKDILIGDVWMCSGQSNMVHQLRLHAVYYPDAIKNAHYPQIRQFWIPTLTRLKGPALDLPEGYWKPAISKDVGDFSAVAYFFAKDLYDKYHIPIGIINASVGGTPIEAWISNEGFTDFDDELKTIEKNKDTSYINSFKKMARQRYAGPEHKDKGLSGDVPWYSTAYIPKGWRRIGIPGYWEDQGVKGLNGVVWYRKEISIPQTMAGKTAKVYLGRIVDADELYINGQQVGNTTYQYPQRRYEVPAGLLKSGKNLFVIRVTNQWGKGGFVPDKPYYMFTQNDTVDLKGYWDYKVGKVFVPKPMTGRPGFFAQNAPTALYNAMVAPVTGYSIKGFIWYQGESNTGQPQKYGKLLPALIKDWRTKWKDNSLPFLFVQLPGFGDFNYLPSESNSALLRESQRKTLSVPNTAMAVTIELGEWNDIHPDRKKPVGERLALAAEKLAYAENIVSSGPLYKSAMKEGNKIVLTFSDIGKGLSSTDGEPLQEFAIAGDDRNFVWANAKIEGDKVVVYSDNVKNPRFVRYAWADNPVNPNFGNKDGLPASPFEATIQ